LLGLASLAGGCKSESVRCEKNETGRVRVLESDREYARKRDRKSVSKSESDIKYIHTYTLIHRTVDTQVEGVNIEAERYVRLVSSLLSSLSLLFASLLSRMETVITTPTRLSEQVVELLVFLLFSYLLLLLSSLFASLLSRCTSRVCIV